MLTDDDGTFSMYMMPSAQRAEERGTLIPPQSRYKVRIVPPQGTGLLPYTGDIYNGQTETIVLDSAGYEHTCAVVAGDAALCWGSNSNGQLGVGTGPLREYYATPVLLDDTGAELMNVKAIDTGFNATCAIVGDERDLYCWGQDSQGMLGNGLPLEDAFYPAAVTCTP